MRCLAWWHAGKVKLLLICKVDQPRTVSVRGLTGRLDRQWIDDSIPWRTASIQTGEVDAVDVLTLRGYTVLLLST